jgi:hypothetical protein
MHFCFQLINAIRRGKVEVLSFEGIEKAFNHRAVRAIAFPARTLYNATRCERRSMGLYLAGPALVGVHDQF